MGQNLSEPVVEKTSFRGQDERLLFGVSSMQGWRVTMEDSHACVLDLRPGVTPPPLEQVSADGNSQVSDASPASPSPGTTPADKRISFFGVYDGHGGDRIAQYVGENLHRIVASQSPFAAGGLEQALRDGFLATDRALLADPKYREDVSGCTATVAVVSNDKIYVANAGDSRTVLGIKGRAKPLSTDHKPQSEAEKERITAAGGFVDYGRVNGNLALSRAIGDFDFKKNADLPAERQIVTSLPDVTVHDLTDDDEFIVVACDGIWDCQSSQSVVEFVRRGIAARQELHAICENLIDNCLAPNTDTGGIGCDNMTLTIVGLLKGRTKDEWYDAVASRVASGDGPCAPPEYAEFRGPGVHHRFEESSEELDAEHDEPNRGRLFGGRFGALGGRIFLLGDSDSSPSADATSADSSDAFDNDDETLDLVSHIRRTLASASAGRGRLGRPVTDRVTEQDSIGHDDGDDNDHEDDDDLDTEAATRAQREETPEPSGETASATESKQQQLAGESTTENQSIDIKAADAAGGTSGSSEEQGKTSKETSKDTETETEATSKKG